MAALVESRFFYTQAGVFFSALIFGYLSLPGLHCWTLAYFSSLCYSCWFFRKDIPIIFVSVFAAWCLGRLSLIYPDSGQGVTKFMVYVYLSVSIICFLHARFAMGIIAVAVALYGVRLSLLIEPSFLQMGLWNLMFMALCLQPGLGYGTKKGGKHQELPTSQREREAA